MWFRPRRFGYGATPVDGRGWAVIALYLGLVFGALGLVRFLIDDPLDRVALGVMMVALLTAPFVAFVKSRTAGEWRWRMGKE